MKPTDMQIQPKRRKLCVPSLLVGMALAGIAGTATYVDASNNLKFGLSISPELGMVMCLAALALAIIPAAAALIGRWDNLMRAGIVLATVLTVWSALSAYAEKQGSEILARQANQVSYESATADAAQARQEIEAARAEAAAIGEPLPAAQLQQILDAKTAAAQQHERWGPTKGCTDVTIPISREFCDQLAAEKQALLVRIGQAKAKADTLQRIESAQARLDAAKGDLKSGPAEASMLATMISWRVAATPEDIARLIALLTTLGSISVTLCLALMAHQATALLMKGFGMDGIARQEGVGSAAAVESLKTVQKPPRSLNRPQRRLNRLSAHCALKTRFGASNLSACSKAERQPAATCKRRSRNGGASISPAKPSRRRSLWHVSCKRLASTSSSAAVGCGTQRV